LAQDLKASVSFVGDGTTTKFYFGFDYISKQFIKVAVGTDDTILSYPTDYTVNDKEVEFVEAPAKDTPIRIYRQTDSSRIIEWSDGSFIKASQMTLENVQQLHLIEEAQDYVIINGMSKYPDGVNFNALGARVINVADPKEPQDVVTKHYMETVQGGFVSQNTALVEQATTQATNAKNSASSAATSASQSASSASASETSNQLAKKWAESEGSPDGLDDSLSTTSKTKSAKGWAMQAKEYAGSLNLSFIINTLFPVGALLEFTNDTNPNELYPGTTWVKMDGGRVLVSAGTYTESGTTYTYNLGDTGGEAKHQLTTGELASHTHGGSVTTASLTGAFTTAEHERGDATEANGVFSVGSFASQNGPTSGQYLRRWVNFNGSHSHGLTINNTGNGTAHENRMPYVVVNRWTRTA
jgi:microcystin-dependent protein